MTIGHNIFVLAEGSCTNNQTVFGNSNGTSQAGSVTTSDKRAPAKRAAGKYVESEQPSAS